MKTSLLAFGISILFTQHVHAQLYATGEINGLYLKPNGYNEESAFLPGAIFSFGYYEFMSNYDVYLNAGIGLPKLTHYTSTIFGETSFDVSEMSRGIYFIRPENTAAAFGRKLILE